MKSFTMSVGSVELDLSIAFAIYIGFNVLCFLSMLTNVDCKLMIGIRVGIIVGYFAERIAAMIVELRSNIALKRARPKKPPDKVARSRYFLRLIVTFGFAIITLLSSFASNHWSLNSLSSNDGIILLNRQSFHSFNSNYGLNSPNRQRFNSLISNNNGLNSWIQNISRIKVSNANENHWQMKTIESVASSDERKQVILQENAHTCISNNDTVGTAQTAANIDDAQRKRGPANIFNNVAVGNPTSINHAAVGDSAETAQSAVEFMNVECTLGVAQADNNDSTQEVVRFGVSNDIKLSSFDIAQMPNVLPSHPHGSNAASAYIRLQCRLCSAHSALDLASSLSPASANSTISFSFSSAHSALGLASILLPASANNNNISGIANSALDLALTLMNEMSPAKSATTINHGNCRVETKIKTNHALAKRDAGRWLIVEYLSYNDTTVGNAQCSATIFGSVQEDATSNDRMMIIVISSVSNEIYFNVDQCNESLKDEKIIIDFHIPAFFIQQCSSYREGEIVWMHPAVQTLFYPEPLIVELRNKEWMHLVQPSILPLVVESRYGMGEKEWMHIVQPSIQTAFNVPKLSISQVVEYSQHYHLIVVYLRQYYQLWTSLCEGDSTDTLLAASIAANEQTARLDILTSYTTQFIPCGSSSTSVCEGAVMELLAASNAENETSRSGKLTAMPNATINLWSNLFGVFKPIFSVCEGEETFKSKPPASAARHISEGALATTPAIHQSKPCLVCEGEETKQNDTVSKANEGALASTPATSSPHVLRHQKVATVAKAIKSASKQFTLVTVPILAAIAIISYTTVWRQFIVGSIRILAILTAAAVAKAVAQRRCKSTATDAISRYIHHGKHNQHNHQCRYNIKNASIWLLTFIQLRLSTILVRGRQSGGNCRAAAETTYAFISYAWLNCILPIIMFIVTTTQAASDTITGSMRRLLDCFNRSNTSTKRRRYHCLLTLYSAEGKAREVVVWMDVDFGRHRHSPI